MNGEKTASGGIDFVIPWVDGSDPAWQREFVAARLTAGGDASVARFRDWHTLRYWFRAVERFAPWVRRIHFITWGHLPEWLDTAHPRLHVVRHADYLPAQYRPTFNSNAIELNIHRIEGLSERFVLFNDDTFLGRPAAETDFFLGDVPRDMARLSIPAPEPIAHTILNAMMLIAARYKPRQVVRRNPGKWFSRHYRASDLMKNLLLLPWSVFPGISDHHMPQAYRKSSFERAWQLWGAEIDATCRHPFRTSDDLSHWLIRYDTLCRGEFRPTSFADCAQITLSDTGIDPVRRDIARSRYRMFCLHDDVRIADPDTVARTLCGAFGELLPERSSFER